jgi:hypothetical protein
LGEGKCQYLPSLKRFYGACVPFALYPHLGDGLLFLFLVASFVMATFDWTRYLNESEEQRLLETASLGPPAHRLQIAEEISEAALEHEGIKITAAEILAAIERAEDVLLVDMTLALLTKVRAGSEPATARREPVPTYDRDRAGRRRPLRR